MMLRLLILTSLLAIVTSQQCNTKETCGACIQTANCAWCSQPSQFYEVRCVSYEHVQSNPQWCHPDYIQDPQHDVQVVRDEPLRASEQNKDAVQIKPQHVQILKARPGVPIKLEFEYAQADDYPVDLYYLMDLSRSMLDDKEQLSALGEKIATAMEKLSSNFRLGFGSFVDKIEMPFVNTIPAKLKSPCTGCTSPYSYKNHLALTENISLFSDEVKRTPISSNIDSPEGGFDALMQAMVCTKEIGWRQKARHMIVYSTDAESHFAGDGKLAGIVEPNDEKCHLDNNQYTHGLLQDYPSVGQINTQAKAKNINIIFAVTANVKEIYNLLETRIDGSSTGTLSKDSSNIVNFIIDQYSKLSSGITMTDTAGANVRVKYFSACTGNHVTETKSCDGLRQGLVVKFEAEITVLECPKGYKEWVEKFEIKPQSLNESLLVQIQVECSCECERPNNKGFQGNSAQCRNRGNSECGICACQPDFVGRNCECQRSQSYNVNDNTLGCRVSNNTDVVCNGRGDCVCGTCVCQQRKNPLERVYGTYCECDNFSSCKRHNGELCSGLSHGECNCGVCKCKREWSGDACQCATSSDYCRAPRSSQICSGNGRCECGECICYRRYGHRYGGRYCEDCLTCTGQCQELKSCVEILTSPGHKELNDSMECNFTLHIVNTLDDDLIASVLIIDDLINDESHNEFILHREIEDEYESNDEINSESKVEKDALQGSTQQHRCNHVDPLGCSYSFIYSYDTNDVLNVFALRDRECNKDIKQLKLVTVVVGSILLGGLMLAFIWRIILSIHDCRQFAVYKKRIKKKRLKMVNRSIYTGVKTD